MPITNDDSEKQLHLEGATLAAVDATGGSVLFRILGTEIYHENHLERFEASLVVADSGIPSHLILPSEITDILISIPGVCGWGVFVPFPFSISGPCQVHMSLRSGERVAVSGSSCHVELGQGTCHAYSLEPHNGA